MYGANPYPHTYKNRVLRGKNMDVFFKPFLLASVVFIGVILLFGGLIAPIL